MKHSTIKGAYKKNWFHNPIGLQQRTLQFHRKRMKDLCSTYRAHFWGQISNSIVQVYQMFFFQSKPLQKIWQFSILTICLLFRLGLKIFVSLLKYILCSANKYKRRNGYPITREASISTILDFLCMVHYTSVNSHCALHNGTNEVDPFGCCFFGH